MEQNIEKELYYLSGEKAAHFCEDHSLWGKAAIYWRNCNRIKDAEACEIIQHSIDEGNKLRAEVLEKAGKEPSKENPHEWIRWYNKMSEIYKKHYS